MFDAYLEKARVVKINFKKFSHLKVLDNFLIVEQRRLIKSRFSITE